MSTGPPLRCTSTSTGGASTPHCARLCGGRLTRAMMVDGGRGFVEECAESRLTRWGLRSCSSACSRRSISASWLRAFSSMAGAGELFARHQVWATPAASHEFCSRSSQAAQGFGQATGQPSRRSSMSRDRSRHVWQGLAAQALPRCKTLHRRGRSRPQLVGAGTALSLARNLHLPVHLAFCMLAPRIPARRHLNASGKLGICWLLVGLLASGAGAETRIYGAAASNYVFRGFSWRRRASASAGTTATPLGPCRW